MPSKKRGLCWSDTIYRQHIIAHILLLQGFLQYELGCDEVRSLVPTRDGLDGMSVIGLMTLFDRLSALGKTLYADSVNTCLVPHQY